MKAITLNKRKKLHTESYEQKFEIVFDLILQGLSSYNIKKYFEEQAKKGIDLYKITPRQVENYIKDVRTFIRSEAKIKRSYELGKAINRYEKLYFKCYNNKEYKNCIAINDKLTNLIGLNVVNINLNNTDDNYIKISKADLEKHKDILI